MNCKCGRVPCKCGGCQTADNRPYYRQSVDVEEDHTQVFNTVNYATAVTTGSVFGIPVCNSTVTILLPSVTNLQVGAYLWNAVYGYLEVISFDKTNQTAVVKNNCNVGNVAIGTQVPACSLFQVVDPPKVDDLCPGDANHVLANFVSPALNATVNVTVSALVGLTIGTNVQIGVGTYQLTAIVDSNTITIKNIGSGETPGSNVYAKDVNGRCILPVVPYSPNPCAVPTNDTGSIIVCSNGVAGPLAGTQGQIPVVIDGAGTVQMQTIAIPTEICTYMIGTLNLIAGIPQYTISVHDASIFNTSGQVIVINSGDIAGEFWYISSIDLGASTITVNHIGAQTHTELIPADVSVCVAGCCDQLRYDFSIGLNICHWGWATAFGYVNQNAGGYNIGTLTPGLIFGGDQFHLFVRNITCNPMSVLVASKYYLKSHFNVYPGDAAQTAFQPYFGYATVPIFSAPPAFTAISVGDIWETHNFGRGPNPAGSLAYDSTYSASLSHSEAINLPPLTDLYVFGRAQLYYNYYTEGVGSTGRTEVCTVEVIETRLSCIGIALQTIPNP